MARFDVRWVVALAVFAEVLVASEDAAAQGRRRFFSVPLADLASLEQVQNDLKLSDQQKTKTNEIAGKFQSDRRALAEQGGPGEQMLDKMAELDRQSSAKVLELLDKSQRQRLLGISIQVNGVKALYEPAITQELHFSEEQGKKLEEARMDVRNSFRNAFIQFGSMSESQRRARINQLAEQGDKMLSDVMTKSQQEQFDQLKGAAIDVDLSPLPWNRRRN